MTYTIIYSKINNPDYDEGFFYAYIPAFDLTTHGLGIEGAKAAAIDLVNIWIEEKKSNGELVPVESEFYYSKIEIPDALYS